MIFCLMLPILLCSGEDGLYSMVREGSGALMHSGP
jgi:hypothetical protein